MLLEKSSLEWIPLTLYTDGTTAVVYSCPFASGQEETSEGQESLHDFGKLSHDEHKRTFYTFHWLGNSPLDRIRFFLYGRSPWNIPNFGH